MKSYITGHFTDESGLLEAVKALKQKGNNIRDVLTPYPVHGLDEELGQRRTLLPKVAFIGGAIGLILAYLFQWWIFTVDYPTNFGGKPYYSLPSWIPVIFESTVLFSALSIVFAFLIRSNLGLGSKNKIYSERITNDQFVIVLDCKNKQENEITRMTEILNSYGADEVNINMQDK
jgi:hypothetical protein